MEVRKRMNKAAILALYEKELRVEYEDPDTSKEMLPRVIRLERARPAMGFIRYSRLDSGNADAEIRAQMAYFASRGMPFEWVVFDHDQPADLEGRLLDLGFVPDQEPDDPGAVLVLDLEQAPANLLEPVSIDVRQVTDPRRLDDIVGIEERVWGGDFSWLKDRLAAHLAIPGYLSLQVGYIEGELACCGWVYYYPNSHFAILRGGSTVPSQRRRGLYAAVLATRAQEALGRGYRFLTVDASPMSRPQLEKHGFHLLTNARSYKWGVAPDATTA
jgi:hypothetical protein